MIQYYFSFGGVGFRFTTTQPVRMDDFLAPFLRLPPTTWDIDVELKQTFAAAPRPKGKMAGSDLLLEYYREGEGLLCQAKGGPKGPIAITQWDDAFAHLVTYINPAYPLAGEEMGIILRLIPMRGLLQRRGVLFFHAAQVLYRERGILFTAPSGTGKTTQAKLWRDVLGARIICNDRTLIRQGRTFGYPVDGSDPICSGEVHSLGAVVLLSQGQENQIHRLGPAQAVAKLMPQLVMDTWSGEARETAVQQLLELAAQTPIYHLSCTPEPAAVKLLEKTLHEEGILG